MEGIISSRRPSEIVRNYLEAEFNNPDLPSGTRLPSINALARQLDVSSSTVQTVLGEMANEGLVRSVRGKGVFLVKDEAPVLSPRVISINVSPGQMKGEDVWGGLIALGVMNELSRNGEGLLLRPAECVNDEGSSKAFVAREKAECDGAILFPRPHAISYARVFEEAGKPVIFLGAPATYATRNFVSTDFHGNVDRLSRAWLQTGRRRIALLLQSPPRPGHVTSMQLLAGFSGNVLATEGAAFHHGAIENPSTADIPELLEMLTDKLGGAPDAIYCLSPILAERLVDAFNSRGIKVGQEISIVAGTSHERLNDRKLKLSVFAQSLSDLGAEAARMLAWRFKHEGQDAPGRYLPCDYVNGDTTRPEEDTLIRLFAAQERV